MNPDPGSSVWGQLLLILILTLVNAFFAAAEIALVSLSRVKMEEQANKGDKKARVLVQVLGHSNQFLATIQVAITFAGFLSSASAATTIAGRLAPLLGNAAWTKEAAVLIVTIVLSYVSLVFGELYPKQVALHRAEAIAKITVQPVRIVGILLRPFVWLLSMSTSLLMKLTPIDFSETEPKLTREEMVHMIESGKSAGVLETDEYEMLEGIITLNKKMAREVMVPRTDAFMIDICADNDQNIDAILAQPFSRIPVYRDDKDQVVGVVHIKNLLKEARQKGFQAMQIEAVMKEPLFVPETITIDDLLFEMKRTQQQMAILLDEYGGVVGLATIEDLLEEIVGEIDDESDKAEELYQKIDAQHYIVMGSMPINEFNSAFNTDIQVTDVDTIAGFVITEIGAIPVSGHPETIELPGGMSLTTGSVSGSRLIDLQLTLPEPETDAPEEVD
ncbi:hemolysin family protein [Latilactobacillus curvatus]|uniref:hemolysin family protein n=1 Tax=Latilactobacillus curvatus TaxID=28038 RepID=UPI000DAAE0C3|nr:hemolysin family protein [Latilactobacillus curvatus]AWV72484.1 HlyC/CorC family transporter [Latilactobacillus curvatus]MCS8582275.1 HlyC/CorC family transporter [Latilactobacillus curvatus]MCS8605596.1 HlyC/CorC family transporter [Latilactobacillus curvatus]MCT3526387.1 HlyC/CorC family transporter [Latilactobacillus curvatus]MDG2986683.1 hemolysin family protein [Latilactobacillus curvatus]